MVALAVLVAAVVTLPLALWDIKAFLHSAIVLQLHQPYRADALSFLAWWGNGDPAWTGPFWLAFAALAVAAALSLWRGERSPAGFATAVAFCFFAFFGFNKQAFANYYYFLLGALCCAVAANAGMESLDSDADICR